MPLLQGQEFSNTDWEFQNYVLPAIEAMRERKSRRKAQRQQQAEKRLETLVEAAKRFTRPEEFVRHEGAMRRAFDEAGQGEMFDIVYGGMMRQAEAKAGDPMAPQNVERRVGSFMERAGQRYARSRQPTPMPSPRGGVLPAPLPAQPVSPYAAYQETLQGLPPGQAMQTAADLKASGLDPKAIQSPEDLARIEQEKKARRFDPWRDLPVLQRAVYAYNQGLIEDPTGEIGKSIQIQAKLGISELQKMLNAYREAEIDIKERNAVTARMNAESKAAGGKAEQPPKVTPPSVRKALNDVRKEGAIDSAKFRDLLGKGHLMVAAAMEKGLGRKEAEEAVIQWILKEYGEVDEMEIE